MVALLSYFWFVRSIDFYPWKQLYSKIGVIKSGHLSIHEAVQYVAKYDFHYTVHYRLSFVLALFFAHSFYLYVAPELARSYTSFAKLSILSADINGFGFIFNGMLSCAIIGITIFTPNNLNFLIKVLLLLLLF